MKIQYTVEIEDLVALHQFYIDTSSHARKRRLILVIMFELVFLFLGLLLWHYEDSVFPLICFGTLAVVFPVWYWHAMSKWVTKFYEKEKEGDRGTFCQHELEILPDGLIERTPVGEQKIRFQGIDRIESTATHSFVFIGTLSAHVIPHGKITEGDVDSFITTLRQKWEANQALKATV